MLSWLQSHLQLGSGFPSTPFPCTQSVPESAPKEMKVVVPVSAHGPRDPPLWDLETPIPASAFLGLIKLSLHLDTLRSKSIDWLFADVSNF